MTVVERTCCCVCCIDEKRAVDSLFIVNWTGTLTEYILEPRVKSGLEKITDESPIEVLARAWAQWPLARSVFLCRLLLLYVKRFEGRCKTVSFVHLLRGLYILPLNFFLPRTVIATR